MKQDYIIKKHVRAESAAEALAMDAETPPHEVFLAADKPERSNVNAVGFAFVRPEE
jgi:hypothetical protein